MNQIEFELRNELVDNIVSVEEKLKLAKRLLSTEYLNPQDLTYEELKTLKAGLLEAYLESAATVSFVKKINGNSRAQNSSNKVTPQFEAITILTDG